MKAFTAAAVQIAPVAGALSPEVVAANVAKCVEWTRRCVAETGAELVVLPESATTGFPRHPGRGPVGAHDRAAGHRVGRGHTPHRASG